MSVTLTTIQYTLYNAEHSVMMYVFLYLYVVYMVLLYGVAKIGYTVLVGQWSTACDSPAVVTLQPPEYPSSYRHAGSCGIKRAEEFHACRPQLFFWSNKCANSPGFMCECHRLTRELLERYTVTY